MTTEIEKTEKRDSLEFVPFGAADKIKLNVAIIRKLIAVPTKSGKTCSETDAIKFMMLCQAKRLNPFEGDCFLLGYDSRDGVATFSLITAHQAYLKRAEVHPEFDGMKSGVIVTRDDGSGEAIPVADLEGDFVPNGQTLLGGWATVYFKNRKVPMTRRLRLERFKKPYGVWNDDPAGMIVKCAEADALRSSFPTMLGSMRQAVDLHAVRESDGKVVDIVEVATNGDAQPEARTERQLANPPLQASDLRPPAEEPEKPGPSLPGKELGDLVTGWGFTWEQFAIWGKETGNVTDRSGFDEIDAITARRLLRAPAGLKRGLEQVREAQSK